MILRRVQRIVSLAMHIAEVKPTACLSPATLLPVPTSSPVDIDSSPGLGFSAGTFSRATLCYRQMPMLMGSDVNDNAAKLLPLSEIMDRLKVDSKLHQVQSRGSLARGPETRTTCTRSSGLRDATAVAATDNTTSSDFLVCTMWCAYICVCVCACACACACALRVVC